MHAKIYRLCVLCATSGKRTTKTLNEAQAGVAQGVVVVIGCILYTFIVAGVLGQVLCECPLFLCALDCADFISVKGLKGCLQVKHIYLCSDCELLRRRDTRKSRRSSAPGP